MRHLFAASAQGESHKKRENERENLERQRKFPCQDRSFAGEIFALDGTNFSLLVVCDGHGGAPYFRSERGADFAIQVIEDILKRNMKRINELASLKEYEKIRDQLSLAVTKRWREKVDDDLKKFPITEKEYEFLAEERPEAAENYRAGKDLYAVYGCTMVSYFATPKFWYALQIGDGDLCISFDGKSTEMPVSEDKDCFLNQTTSLCDENAASEFRYAAGEQIPVSAFCASDGISNSFKSDEQLKAFFRSVSDLFYDSSLVAQAENLRNPNTVHLKSLCALADKEILDYLPVLSKKGSGDDVSIACDIQINADYVQAVKNYARGYKLYKNGQKKDGRDLLLLSAKEDYPEAWFRLGEIIFRDAECLIEVKDKQKKEEILEKSKKCFEKARELGIPEAEANLNEIERMLKGTEETDNAPLSVDTTHCENPPLSVDTTHCKNSALSVDIMHEENPAPSVDIVESASPAPKDELKDELGSGLKSFVENRFSKIMDDIAKFTEEKLK